MIGPAKAISMLRCLEGNRVSISLPHDDANAIAELIERQSDEISKIRINQLEGDNNG